MIEWMAWTWPTAVVFSVIFGSIGLLSVIETFYPGGQERVGILGFTTTRGDRLFLSILISVYIFFVWLFFFGAPFWAPLVIAALWTSFCFWKV